MRAPSSFVQSLIDGDLESTKKLLLAGAEVNATYGEGKWTALHFAVENQVAESVSWLLERDADINAKDTFGQTPLHLAIDSEADSARQQFDVTGVASLSGEITMLLLKNGADANARTIRGKTPLDIGRATGHSVAVEELKRYGGQ